MREKGETDMTILGKSPAFQFYPEAFLSDENVQLMNYEERGIYITLLSHCWLEGSIPSDPEKITRLLKSGFLDLTHVLKCFTELEDNPERLINPRLDRERTKQFEWKKKCSKGGKASAKKRARVVTQPKEGKRHILPSISVSNSFIKGLASFPAAQIILSASIVSLSVVTHISSIFTTLSFILILTPKSVKYL